jgi:methionine synthase II (cobalamin-independent)
MFSTLLGPLPAAPDQAEVTAEDRIRGTLAELEMAGLELLSIGEAPDLSEPPEPTAVAGAWRFAAGATTRPVKQVLPGPYSAGRAGDRSAASWATALRPTILALADAGCPFVEIDEFDALAITVVEPERRRFVEAHRLLTDGIDGIHLSLALTGGNLAGAGPSTFFDLPYASYAFDLIAGPENWRLIAVAPTDRGIVCGALSPKPDGDQTREVLVWAAHYAASTSGRGAERVGLANASSMAALSRTDALGRLKVVADATRIAAVESPDELARILDPRAVGRSRPARPRE